LITITRRQAQRLCAVRRRAFGPSRGQEPSIGFIADAEGLSVRTMHAEIAVDCHVGEEPALGQLRALGA